MSEEMKPFSKEIDLAELAKKIRASRILILKACGIGAAIGLAIGFSTPKEYTASTLIIPESRKSYLGVSALADMENMDISPSSTTEKDAIFPVLYPEIIGSTPFLIQLFDIKVREQKDSIAIPLFRYLKERRKRPWWSAITSAPSKLTSWIISLFCEKPETKEKEKKSAVNPFWLTREEARIASAIASRINIEVDEKKRAITIFVTMQDPQVAATVADAVRVHLREYITEYRTSKARRFLKYTEKLRKEAQEEYYSAQEEYTRYADANRGLARLTSRAELVRLRNEMKLALASYNQIERLVRAAMARVERVRPVYAVIQPVVVPLTPSKPRKMKLLVIYVFLSGAGSAAWVLFAKDFLKGRKKKKTAVG